MFSEVINHTSLFGSLMDESVFGGPTQNRSANSRVWWRSHNGLGLFWQDFGYAALQSIEVHKGMVLIGKVGEEELQ